MQPEDKDPNAALAEDLSASLRRTQNSSQAVYQTSASQSENRMKLPPGVAEESARIFFDFWESNAANAERRERRPWETVSPQHRMMWVQITRVALEMYTSILLTDIHKFLNQSNGDLGAAFARALRRYAKTILNTIIKP